MADPSTRPSCAICGQPVDGDGSGRTRDWAGHPICTACDRRFSQPGVQLLGIIADVLAEGKDRSPDDQALAVLEAVTREKFVLMPVDRYRHELQALHEEVAALRAKLSKA